MNNKHPPEATERTNYQSGPRKSRRLGLALSGGGFRATAFHLDVLKRLREIGILKEVDILSTVSGGSIVGAYWVYWQATNASRIPYTLTIRLGGALSVKWLTSCAGGCVADFYFGTFIPLLLIAFLLLGGSWLISLLPASTIESTIFSILLFASFGLASAYLIWRGSATMGLSTAYDRALFLGEHFSTLDPRLEKGNPRPDLVVNSTNVALGARAYAATDAPFVRIIMEAIRDRKYPRHERRLVFPFSADRVSHAVAASSAFPFVFTPLKLHFYFAKWFPLLPSTSTPYALIDGGVSDNQGTQILIDRRCRRLLVCDAASALRRMRAPSWQLGIVGRSHDIICEQVRELGYRRMEARHDLYRLLDKAKENGLSVD